MLNPFTALTTFVAFAQDRLRNEEKGATAVEYGLMVGLIAVAIIFAVTTLGDELAGLFDGIGTELGEVPVGGAGAGTGTTGG
ncbi:Flp family type IVb pilin [Blastococcus sp. TF02A-35]|uniref:Flp family type IVb pilin n=1 Tax=Blastococcus sp. TF02A-35 TaxID=2559612 RepID=UPI00107392E3|nr:Flp family type IVb pilin [Blastococcus sp. TF02A_35]TFV51921.1 Flp family type IVb pilin [Blastococcus sp. TF02A_35]